VGEGGMGAVYKAHDRNLDRIVALKFLRENTLESAGARSRFLREARAVSRLNHRNIAVIHAIEECEGETFLVFEYLAGGTLRSRLQSLRSRGALLDTGQAARYAMEIAEGLAHAHAHGTIHRDIKPANIMFGPDGIPKVVDFGVSKLKGCETQTRTGDVLGTPLYMAPEQAQAKAVDERCDIFSLGLVLYEMVAGQPAFRADRSEAAAYRIVHDPVPPIPACPPKLTAIIQRSLEKNPERRYQRMADFAADLRRLVRGPAAAELPTETIHAGRPGRRRFRTATLAVTFIVLLATMFLAPVSGRLWPRLPADKRVAFLPFENATNDTSNEAFCDGLQESAIATLRQLQPGLVITPASEIRRMAIQTTDKASKLAGANVVVRGKVRKNGDRVEVDLSLFSPAKPRALDSRTIVYDPLRQASIQQETGLALAKMLGFNAAGRKLLTVSPVATADEAYLEGIGYSQRDDTAANLAKEIDALERATKADPNFTSAYVALSVAYQHNYRGTKDRQYLDRAREYAEKGISLDDSSASAHAASGAVLSLGGDQEGAIREFRRALALDPVNVEALRQLAAAYDVSGRTVDAEATYRKAVDSRRSDWLTLAELGAFHYNHQQYAEAEKDYRAAVALAPDNPTHHRNLGGVYTALGRFPDTERELLKSIELNPSSSAYSNLAAVYIYEARYRDAIYASQKALALLPPRIARAYSIWGNLGDAYRYTPDQAEKAADAYRHAIDQIEQQLAFDPDNAGLLASVAEYAAKMGDHKSALDAIGRAMRFAHGSRRVSFQAALVYEITGSRERALAALGDAIRGGYSLDEIAREPELAELRQDPRYKQILKTQPATNSSG
jgi:serine/threonine-protein kinase